MGDRERARLCFCFPTRYANAGVIDPVQLRGLAKRAGGAPRHDVHDRHRPCATTRQFSRNWQLVETATIHSVMAQTMRLRQSRPSSMVFVEDGPAASLLIKPTSDVSGIMVLNDLSTDCR